MSKAEGTALQKTKSAQNKYLFADKLIEDKKLPQYQCTDIHVYVLHRPFLTIDQSIYLVYSMLCPICLQNSQLGGNNVIRTFSDRPLRNGIDSKY